MLIRTAKGDIFVFLFSLAAYQSLYPLLLLLPLSIQIAQHEGQILPVTGAVLRGSGFIEFFKFGYGSGSGSRLFVDSGSGSRPIFFITHNFKCTLYS
jgi:hypothetical protein